MKTILMKLATQFEKTVTQLSAESGCLPQCTVQEVEFKEIDLQLIVHSKNITSRCFIQIQCLQMGVRIIKETYLYDINNLIGELGGSLGFFLGISVVSLYDQITTYATRFHANFFIKTV